MPWRFLRPLKAASRRESFNSNKETEIDRWIFFPSTARGCSVVRDEGSGIPFDVLRRAGEPFFTTKEAGRGFGLGLFLARVFAERCGGTLSLRSDRGTTATLTLPLSAPVSGQ